MKRTLQYVLRDLTRHPGRSLLAIMALSIGLWGAASNLTSYFILKNDLNQNFLRTEPLHVALSADDFSTLNLDRLRLRPEIESAEFRDLSYLRIEVHPDQWIPLWLFAVDDFSVMRVAKIFPQQGAHVPPTGTILIERNGQMVSQLKVGAKAHIRSGVRDVRVDVAGITFDPAQAPATQDAFIYAYTDNSTYQSISGEAPHRRLIVRFRNVSTTGEVHALTTRLSEDFRKMGIAINGIKTPAINRHPHQFQLNTLIAFQGVIGILAFVMGSVLVSQLIEAWLAQQVRQIGILKAIGATPRRIFGIYVLRIMLLGALATLITLPIAILSGFGFAGFVAKVLNFDIITTHTPSLVVAVVIVLGLLLPILISLPTLIKGLRIPVVAALGDYGISAPASSKHGSDLPLPFSFRLRMAIRNVLRRKRRSMITIGMIALGVSIFGAGFNVRQSLIDFLEDSKSSMKYDVQLVLRHSIAPTVALAPFAGLSSVSRIETWSGGQGRLQSGVVSAGSGIGIVALPRDTDLKAWDVIKGRWLQPSAETEIVINQSAADELQSPTVGESLTIQLEGIPVQARLVGVIKEFDAPKIYLDKAQYDALANHSHSINTVLFTARDRGYEGVVALKQEVERLANRNGLDVLFVMSQAERAKIIFEHLNIILTLFTFLSLLVLVVAALGMAATMGINIVERTREIGVLRAIGATPGYVYTLFLAEGQIINAIAVFAGLLLSLPLSAHAAEFFGHLILGHNTTLRFAFSPLGLAITLLMTLLFSWLAARYPARRAIRIPTHEALSYE